MVHYRIFCFVNFIFYNVNHLQFVRQSIPANWSCSSVSKLGCYCMRVLIFFYALKFEFFSIV